MPLMSLIVPNGSFTNADPQNVYASPATRSQLRQHKSRTMARTVFALIIAGLILAACGVPDNTDTGAVSIIQMVRDVAPAWEPNQTLLDAAINTKSSSRAVVVTAVEFGGLPAPMWDPDYGNLETILTRGEGSQTGLVEPTSGPR
jgi:hypothetical protein